ncbi:hypothetical protein Pcinc_015328 [Petrolisthes cinctipes]|uniref:Uncharacterized protein n=1 Tax=Petrolisthes cinctipes TaxID=88211 RepID=A0AAE1FVZ6_PETCI|nr:hypothetical protein Pcinc_015328 [Petrolisthes cinctipes]
MASLASRCQKVTTEKYKAYVADRSKETWFCLNCKGDNLKGIKKKKANQQLIKENMLLKSKPAEEGGEEELVENNQGVRNQEETREWSKA